jgi:hypothetical protein
LEKEVKEMREINGNYEKYFKTYSENLIPEMISPQQTFRIFLHFIKNIQFEEKLYLKYISQSDIKNIKDFILMVDHSKKSSRDFL